VYEYSTRTCTAVKVSGKQMMRAVNDTILCRVRRCRETYTSQALKGLLSLAKEVRTTLDPAAAVNSTLYCDPLFRAGVMYELFAKKLFVLETVGKTASETCPLFDASRSAAAFGLHIGILQYEYRY
jgi:hypothetical protein